VEIGDRVKTISHIFKLLAKRTFCNFLELQRLKMNILDTECR